jgi:hypothetical protein
MGGLFSIGLYIFSRTLKFLPETEKRYYSLINETAISVTEQIIKEQELKIGKEKTIEIFENQIGIYLLPYKINAWDNIDKEIWNAFPLDHPIVKIFRIQMIDFLKEKDLLKKYPNFAIVFNKKFKSAISHNEIFKKYQYEQTLRNDSVTRRDYFDWVIEEIDKPNPIDGLRTSDHFVKNKVVDLDFDPSLIQKKELWSIAEDRLKELFKDSFDFDLETYLDSKIPIKYIAAPFGTGKTSFLFDLVIDCVKRYLLGRHIWIPIYIPLKNKLYKVYLENMDLNYLLKKIIRPMEEKILLITNNLNIRNKN